MDEDRTERRPLPPLVLVHGGQHGGWCWKAVAARLRAKGAAVYTPTLTGVGERSHLLCREITLETVIRDIVNLLEFEDLEDVVLVGHSFGGLPVTGTADIVPQRIRELVYLDAALPRSGQSAMDVIDDSITIPWLERARTDGEGYYLPLFFDAAEALGVEDPAAQAWMAQRLTPHPLRTYTDRLELRHPLGNGLPATYIVCDAPVFEGLAPSREVAREAGLRFETFPSGHDAMLAAPDLLADRLWNIAARSIPRPQDAR